MPQVIESYPEFCARHGHEHYQINGRLVFGDGASTDLSDMLRAEPPTDHVARLKLRRQFLATKLDNEIAKFNAFKTDCLEHMRLAVSSDYVGSACPGPPANAAQQLEAGKQRIAALQKELNEIDGQLLATPEAAEKRARMEQERFRRQQVHQQLNAINSVTID